MLKVGPKLKVLIVDDSELNREMLGSMLGNEYEILEAEDGAQAVEILREHVTELSLILLDVQMPHVNGLDVLKHMNQFHWIDVIPVIMISSETAPKFIERAYDLGATDYIARPYNTIIVRRRVANVILSFAKQRQLMEIITQQISKKEKDNRLMLSILSHIVEFRNGESGLHVLHINIITDLLMRQYRLKIGNNKITNEDISLVSMASALHDIGKIAIPEEILNKPGRLTAEEFQIMKGHSMAGAEILMDLPIDRNEPLLKTAYEICRWHHERYDGSGYPDGLKGDAIPLSAQVVALADVYDALTSERCYKSAYSHDTAIKMIFDGQCGAFHPLLLECLRDIGNTLEQVLKSKDTFEVENTIKETSHIAEQLNRYGLGDSEHMLHQRSYEQQHFRFLSDMSSKGSLTKLKFIDKCIYHVRATYVEVDGSPYSLELIDKITEETLLGGHGKEDVIKYITAHNRRLYEDILTGAYNRRYYEEQLRDMCHVSAVAMLDMDDFKAVNDTYGHPVGDLALKQIVSAIKNSVRKTDLVIRLGGDELNVR
ncbi:response regulator [Cuneatibacter sp. NSJ-177]|uniref:HD domain-containing phosphohydrolase n=1 Tax=Cuneatibacter sp. NSJ-177 TaxID=2931401 RepID=UPI001FD3A473|nr:diguanylate cyclase [Cuneatibacter sp. NSJ-177]MCJ7834534.1 response regulator [Cuneatibacter sp. NSJ-177]